MFFISLLEIREWQNLVKDRLTGQKPRKRGKEANREKKRYEKKNINKQNSTRKKKRTKNIKKKRNELFQVSNLAHPVCCDHSLPSIIREEILSVTIKIFVSEKLLQAVINRHRKDSRHPPSP